MTLIGNKCIKHDKLSKNALLTYLGSKQTLKLPKDLVVSYAETSGVVKFYRIVKDLKTNVEITNGTETLIVSKMDIVTGTEIYLDKIPYDSWDIASFDSKTREVCITVKTAVSTLHLNYNLNFNP